jgi:hypothetical protein
MKCIIKLSIGILTIFSLVGCSDSFTENAMKVNENNLKEQKSSEEAAKKQQEKQKELYKSMEKPLKEVIKENDLDKKNLLTKKLVVQEEYTDEKEFAKYVGKILFDLHHSKISPEEYYKFLQKYGSQNAKNAMPTKEDAIALLSGIQDYYKSKQIIGHEYFISDVTLNKTKREGYFYRKVITNIGEEYFITTIVKEGEKWKFEEDSPSAPFEIQQNNENKEDAE